jgi:hypothetical protein
MEKSKVVLASTINGDWVALIINGKIIEENHSISAKDMANHLKNLGAYDCEEIEIGSDDDDEDANEDCWYEYIGQFEKS